MADIEYNGVRYQLSPLTLGALERLGDRTAILNDAEAPLSARISVISDVAHESIRRKHPDVTRADVLEMLDMSNMLSVFMQIMQASGLLSDQKKMDQDAVSQ